MGLVSGLEPGWSLNGRDHLHLMPGPANLILMVTGHGAQSLDKLPTHRRSPPLLPGQSLVLLKKFKYICIAINEIIAQLRVRQVL